MKLKRNFKNLKHKHQDMLNKKWLKIPSKKKKAQDNEPWTNLSNHFWAN